MRDEALNKADEELSRLSARVVMASEAAVPELCALAVDFEKWCASLAPQAGPWALQSAALARQVQAGLEAGRPARQGWERLSAALGACVQQLQLLLAGGPAEPGPSLAALAPPPVVSKGRVLEFPEEEREGLRDFLSEAPLLLQEIETALMDLSQGRGWDPLRAYRPFHTIKGICGFLGFSEHVDLAHGAESLLEPHKSGSSRPSEADTDLVLKVCDAFRALLEAISRGTVDGRVALSSQDGLIARLAAAAEGALLALPEEAPEQAAEAEAAGPSRRAHENDIRISIEKMDALFEAVGELAICQAQVSGGIAELGLVGNLATESGRLAKISRQLQEVVLALRMVPIQPLFFRMARMAHELSKKMDKPLALDMEGQETELDKKLVEDLSEPLLHLVRNAVDHGLERPEERAALGKPLQGRLVMRASHQAGDFVLEMEDDGHGLDLAKLAAKGVAMGLLVGGEEHDPVRVTQLIFEPGFSTAETVTDVSGRGVGLDAVRACIQRLKGDIQVRTAKGRGTCFSIRLPLTMALVDGILVRVGQSRYVVPAGQIRKFVAVDATTRHQIGKERSWLQAGGESLPLIELGSWFGREDEGQLRRVALHVESLGRQACLVVDEVIGKQQVVAKGLGGALQSLEGVAGGAILGDGRVSLILDLEALIGRERSAIAQNSH